MKAIYTESCAAGFVTLRGVKFPEGKEVEVKDPELLEKLKANSHFKIVKARKNDANSDRS